MWSVEQAVAQVEPSAQEEEEEIIIQGQRVDAPGVRTAPVYTIDQVEIQKQGSRSAAEAFRGLPGFAINDVGFGADIHVGTFYRGTSINQNTFLLNGRPLTNGVNTYHGGTDFNTIPAGSIERIELSSGGSSTLYGTEAFGGVINVITKQGNQVPKFNASVQFGSYQQAEYRAGYSGSFGPVDVSIGFNRFAAKNDYEVPIGASNRGPDGKLFNGDISTTSFFGRIGVQVSPKTLISFDASTIASRKGIVYFGASPTTLNNEQLDHDGFNLGTTLKTQLSATPNASVLNASIGYMSDSFHSYGPSGGFYRQGRLRSDNLTGRIQHDWQISPNYKLQWGIDLKNTTLNGEVNNTNPRFTRFNGEEDRSRFQTALFALNTFTFSPQVEAELGLRQTFNSQFGGSFNPSVGLRWNVTPSIALRSNWTSVKRYPGLDQMYLFDTVHNWLPNSDLQPERGSSWTAGVEAKLGSTVSAQLTYFGNTISDRLGVQSGRWTNFAKVNTNGLEAALKWKITPQWSTFANYTYTDARIKNGVDQGLQLSTVPFSVGQLGLSYESPGGWQVNLMGNYNSGSRRSIFTPTGVSPRDFSPAWFNVDLSAKVPVTKSVNVTLNLDNLFGGTYERVNRLYQPALTFRLGLSSEF